MAGQYNMLFSCCLLQVHGETRCSVAMHKAAHARELGLAALVLVHTCHHSQATELRAIPATSAPCRIRYTLRHVVETCLFIKEMGPQGFSVNAIDPNMVFNGHDGVLQVRSNSDALEWGRSRTCPIRGAKWGWSGAGPNAFFFLIATVKSNVYQHTSV